MTTDRIIDEAAIWIVRQQDDAMDWDAFTRWLEADPGHRAAYDELALVNAALDQHSTRLAEVVAPSPPVLSPPVPANDREPLRWGRWAGVGGGAIAAGLAFFLVVQPADPGQPVANYRTAAGHSQTIALSDGTRVVLAPASYMQVEGGNIALQGSGYFDVPHKVGRTLSVRAGGFTISDIGTRFSVGNEADGVSVEVAQGSLSVRAPRLPSPITLSAGQGFYANSAAATVRMTKVDPRDVAGWRNGRLQFDRIPLALVARDISRYSGEAVSVDPTIASQPFSGVIAIDRRSSPSRTLAQILSLDARPVAGGIRLEPRRH